MAPIPVWIPISIAAGLGFLLFGSKKANAAVAPAPVRVPPAAKPAPVFKPEAPVFKPEAPKAPAKVDADIIEDMTKKGAVQVATNPSGSVVMKKPDGGLITVLPTIEIVGNSGPTNQGMVQTQKDPLTVRDKPSAQGKKLGTVARFSIVDITGPIVKGDGSQTKGWAPIKQGNLAGYASADLLELDPDQPKAF